MRWYAQDAVNQEDSEQNEVDGMKKGADSRVGIVGELGGWNPSSCLQTLILTNKKAVLSQRWPRAI